MTWLRTLFHRNLPLTFAAFWAAVAVDLASGAALAAPFAAPSANALAWAPIAEAGGGGGGVAVAAAAAAAGEVAGAEVEATGRVEGARGAKGFRMPSRSPQRPPAARPMMERRADVEALRQWRSVAGRHRRELTRKVGASGPVAQLVSPPSTRENTLATGDGADLVIVEKEVVEVLVVDEAG